MGVDGVHRALVKTLVRQQKKLASMTSASHINPRCRPTIGHQQRYVMRGVVLSLKMKPREFSPCAILS